MDGTFGDPVHIFLSEHDGANLANAIATALAQLDATLIAVVTHNIKQRIDDNLRGVFV